MEMGETVACAKLNHLGRNHIESLFGLVTCTSDW